MILGCYLRIYASQAFCTFFPTNIWLDFLKDVTLRKMLISFMDSFMMCSGGFNVRCINLFFLSLQIFQGIAASRIQWIPQQLCAFGEFMDGFCDVSQPDVLIKSLYVCSGLSILPGLVFLPCPAISQLFEGVYEASSHSPQLVLDYNGNSIIDILYFFLLKKELRRWR